jgi:hypothetical protein
MYKELKKLNNKRITQLISDQTNWTDSSWKELQMANKYIKKCSSPLAVKEMQIKMTDILSRSSQNSYHQES